MKKSEAAGRPMPIIVGAGLRRLNAHFCRCLACFSIRLEKCHKSLHTRAVETGRRSGKP
ncbi:Hypothetical protein ABZS17D1_00615 [Kosakonia cowanii]